MLSFPSMRESITKKNRADGGEPIPPDPTHLSLTYSYPVKKKSRKKDSAATAGAFACRGYERVKMPVDFISF
jgi:hypothetical protein